MKNDFIKVASAYFAAVILIMVIIPINAKWALVGLVLVAFSIVLQWYCDRYNKSIPKPLPRDMRSWVILQEAGLYNVLFRGHRFYNKELYENIRLPDIEIILREQMTIDLSNYILKNNEDAFVRKYHSEISTTTLEIELVILTREQFKQLIKYIDNP